ncbi:MAG TPA: ABC transporter permease [Pirellulales bacterium]|nr:ABC transporter permease [Pirellulales bacterium]
MKKLLGLGAFLILLYVLMLLADDSARSLHNHVNLGKRIGLYGVISLGAGILIVTGGIDLSIGSVVGICATIMAMLLTDRRFLWHPAAATAAVLALGAIIGLINGLIVTKLKVQAFVVTLCGLFIYRGAARWLAGDEVQGLENSFAAWKFWLAKGRVLGLPMSLVIFLGLAAVATVFLHFSIHGRYLYAIGSNEQAARYAGVRTDRYRILAYVICSTLTAFFAILFLMEENSVQPSNTGSFFELYAIAGAVLGGCSLRGGEGSILGILIGTAIIRILPTFTQMWRVDPALEYTVIGGALLLGALLDEFLRRRSEKT